jgi:Tol biopolymer transport system component
MPRWSPDGSRLLYELILPNGKHDLCVINKDFTNPINLTKGVGDNTQGVWSPAAKKATGG